MTTKPLLYILLLFGYNSNTQETAVTIRDNKHSIVCTISKEGTIRYKNEIRGYISDGIVRNRKHEIIFYLKGNTVIYGKNRSPIYYISHNSVRKKNKLIWYVQNGKLLSPEYSIQYYTGTTKPPIWAVVALIIK